MSATSSAATQPAMRAEQHRAKRMPSAMQGMCFCTAATASIIIIGTGVYTSVSLVARMLAILLVVLGILISLSGLTGLGGLVGLITRQGISQGD
jgi:cytochrome c biogenesis protein CcdA